METWLIVFLMSYRSCVLQVWDRDGAVGPGGPEPGRGWRSRPRGFPMGLVVGQLRLGRLQKTLLIREQRRPCVLHVYLPDVKWVRTGVEGILCFFHSYIRSREQRQSASARGRTDARSVWGQSAEAARQTDVSVSEGSPEVWFSAWGQQLRDGAVRRPGDGKEAKSSRGE